MSVISEPKQIFSDTLNFLKYSWLKSEKTKCNSASIAITDNGKYLSGIWESRTHLLDITSEQGALIRAVSCKDAGVKEVISVIEGEFFINPIVIKILADHVRRTGISIAYRVFNIEGMVLFSSENVYEFYYAPEIRPLEKIRNWAPKINCVEIKKEQSLTDQLHLAVREGMEMHFSSDSKTSYGAAVVANGKIYFGGVYSSFDHRLNVHAEMAAALSAVMDGNRNIEIVAIISDKFVQGVPQMCGCCRQFFVEIQEKTKIPIKITSFSFDGTKIFETTLDNYLPNAWSSEKKG